MDNKIVTARFATDDNYVNVYDVYQWDYGQVLRIEGLKLPNMVEIHFSLQETSGEAKTRIGITKDGVTDVVIPDSFLENEGIGDNYKISAWVYVADKDSGSTEYKITIHVKARAKPEISHGGQDGEVFQEAVEAVRDAAKRAAESEKQAERWAVGRADIPGSETDNSKFYSEESKKNAQQTTKDKEAVEELVKKTENIGQLAEDVKVNAQKASESAKNAEASAVNASVSEKNAKTSESNASTSETNAKVSETNAKASEHAVEKSKQAVDKAITDFGQAVTDASAALKSEKDVHVKAITTAGTTETKKVTDEGAKQVEMVQSTGTAETKKVTDEGTKQVGLVKTEGEKHLAVVQQAAQEIIADREQIQKNKAEIADLRQNKADAIVETASGTLLNVKDSSGAFFKDFSMSGKTTQDGTPTPDVSVPIVNAGESGNIEIKVTGKNLIPFPYATGNQTINGVSVTVNSNGSITLNGIASTNISVSLYRGKIALKEGMTYVISKDLNIEINGNNTVARKYTAQKGDYISNIWYWYAKSTSFNNLNLEPQLEEGAVNTSYEPCKEPQTITLSSDRPLTKWDRLTEQDGQIGWLYKGKQYIVTGEESLRIPVDLPSYIYGNTTSSFLVISNNDFSDKKGYLNKLPYIPEVWTSQSNKEGYCLNITNQLHVRFANTRLNIEDTASISEREKAIKAHIKQQYDAGTPYVLWYESLQEEFVPLPQEQQDAIRALHTNYPTTIVSNSEDTEMQLTYVADTKNYYLNREQAIQKQILDIQNALISQKISGGGYNPG